jgi:CheY-like chemotaxis protein
MKLPPAYQFPTTTVFLDDNLEFIESLQSGFNSNCAFIKNFESHKPALAYLKENASAKNWSSAWTRVQASDNDFDSVAIEVNFSRISNILKDANRFNHVTVVVVDYQMPDMDGLSFLALLKDIPVKRILLTGVADAEIAVRALDQGLIDSYLKKHDPYLLRKIKNVINNFQYEYFEEQSKLINLASKIPNYDLTLRTAYYNIFPTTKEDHQAIEYYLIDENGSCMFMNKKLERLDLIIRSLEQINSDFVDSANSFKPLDLEGQFYYSIKTSAHCA